MKLIRLFVLFFLIGLQAEETPLTAKKTVCLNMIVKNEKEVIEKCLASAKPLIDYWVIVDTGSNDGTQEIIKKFMKDVPGELHERFWVNFEHNRNEALKFAKDKADYVLFIDADETFEYEKGFRFGNLDKDCYYFNLIEVGTVNAMRASLISTKLPWKWKGVLHEVLDGSLIKSAGLLTAIRTLIDRDAPSGRSKDPQKYLNDAKTLEKALKKEPKNSRYVFYLAQSYALANKYDRALKNYEKRTSMPSEDTQETYSALYACGQMKEKMDDLPGALKSYFKAYEFRPIRAEPIFHAAVIYRKMGKPDIGYVLSKQAHATPYPLDMCVEASAYDHAILIELANCALLTGRWQEGLDACNKLLENKNLSPDIRKEVLKNQDLARKNLNLK